MSPLDTLRVAVVALLRHPMRTGLSLVGIAVGIGAVTVLTSLGEGARRYVEGQFEFLGSDVLVVLPGRSETTGTIPGIGGAPNDLTLEDAVALERRLDTVEFVVPVVLATETISLGERARQSTILATTAGMRDMRALDLVSGEFLPDGALDRGAPVAVLGSKVARELFGSESPVGRKVRIGDWRMRVVGVIAARGTHMGIDMDEMAMIPVATGLRMFNRTSLSRILARLPAGVSAGTAEADIEALLTERHDELDVTVITPGAILGAVGGVLDALSLALAAIAGISLVVAGVGIMNVMLVSVTERTAEVGLLLAVGALRRQVLVVFLAEAALISLVGGALGLAGGVLVVQALGLAFPAFPVATPVWVVGTSIVVALGVGVLFGVLPAQRATRLDPVAALARR